MTPVLLFYGPIIIVGVIIAIVVIRARRMAPEDRRPLLLLFGRFFALLFAALMAVGLVVGVVGMLASNTVSVSLPVQEFWPENYPWITLDPAPAATVVGGGFTRADVVVSGLGMDARLTLAAAGAVKSLTLIVIASVIALLCHRLLGGTPFRPLLARSTTWAAVVATVGGIAWQVLFEIGEHMASRQVLQHSGWSSEMPSSAMTEYVSSHFDAFATGLPEASGSYIVDPWPLMLGLALAAVAAAFRYSERLQKDTEGLV